MDKLRSETELLREHAIDDPIKEVAHEFVRLSSKWENIFDHAKRFDINLDDFAPQVSAIENDLAKVEKIVSQRQGNSLLERIIPPVLNVADKLDNILHGLTGRRVFRPVAEAFLTIAGYFTRLLASPEPKPLLPAPSEFPDYFSDENLQTDVDLNKGLVNVVEGSDGKLHPRPGFSWVTDVAGDFRVRWQPGKKHTNYPNVIASEDINNWRPAPGYKFVNDIAGDFRVVWSPGIRHRDHPNVIASDKEGSWKPASGYTWLDAESRDLHVIPSNSA